MRRIFLNLVLMSVLVPLAQLSLPAEQCRPDSLRGGFAFTTTGAITVPDFPLSGPFGHIGRVVFDGEGKIQATSFASYNGLIVDEPFDGAHRVNSDCTGALAANFRNTVVHFRTVQSTDSKDLGIISLSPGAVVTGRMRKVSSVSCSAADLAGSYRIELAGQVSQPPTQAGYVARFGRFIADGAGRFTAGTTVSHNGFIADENLSGTYTLGSDCLLTIRYDARTQAGVTRVTLWGAAFDVGDGAFLMQVEPPGGTITGSLSRAPRR